MSPTNWRRWIADEILKHSEPKKDGKKKEKKEERKKDTPENRKD
jgi:hypothetical protein